MEYSTSIAARFRQLYAAEPLLICSPGRINLIGEHTDYNQGWVLPAAIDKHIFLAISGRSDNKICLFSEDYQEKHESSLDAISPSGKLWPDYILGVARQLLNDGHSLGGFNVVFGGDIPLGAGLSSSAALECAAAFGLNKIYDLGYQPLELALKAQAAENQFVGVQCGLMDQFASVFGKSGHLIKLDCATRKYSYIPFSAPDLRIVLFDTQVKHSLAASAYNERRRECETGVAMIARHHPEVSSLRDVTPAMLLEHVKPHDETVYTRCSYVIAEMERLHKACEDLQRNDFRQFGQRMFETHEGLKNQYEVSCPELDILVDLVKDQPGVLGARMMGGGFGGCTINLVHTDAAEALAIQVANRYQELTNMTLKTYYVSIEDGTGEVAAF